MSDADFLAIAIEQARLGRAEGGIPIGAALVADGEVLGAGRNRRVQEGSTIHHGETNALEVAGRQPAEVYGRATMYTTLSPCHMCTGAMLLYGIRRVVIGENRTFMGAEDLLRDNGVEVVVLDSDECHDLMSEFIAAEPSLWNEDIGVVDMTVPVIDISGWESGDAVTRDAIAASIDDACCSVGFMQITGHGIADETVAALTNAIDSVFGLDPEVKRQYQPARPSINRGYAPPKSERLSYSLGVDSPADMFEAFNVGVTHEPVAGIDPDMYPENIWPDPAAAPNFQADAQCWIDAAGELARRMSSIFAHALGVGSDFFEPLADRSIDVLRMVNYAIPEGTALERGQLGMGAHTDYGIVTILWADPVPGLEILGGDGRWHSVLPQPGALLINLGDMLARWTNDRYRSTMHRVVPPMDANGRSIRRRSAAFFHDGNADAVVSTLSTCRDADGGSPYEDVTVAEHLAQKLGGSRGLELNQHAGREAARIETVSN